MAARALLSLLLLYGILPSLLASSSSERTLSSSPQAVGRTGASLAGASHGASSEPLDAAELVRDAPLYPPLQRSPDYDLPDPETSIEENSILVTPKLNKLADIRHKNDDSYNNNESSHTDDLGRVSDGINELGDDTQNASDVIENDGDRRKRSSGTEWDRVSKTANRRVQTADTILNIRGALRDGIGDAGAAPGARASSRVDAFVIRPAAAATAAPPVREVPRVQPVTNQAPRHRELLVEAHARARIACDLRNVTQLRWYRDSELVTLPSSHAGSEAMWTEADAVIIARATRSDSALWRCAGVDNSGRTVSGKPTQLLIYEAVRSLYLAVDGRRLDAGNTWVPVRDKAVLDVRCVAEGGVPAPELSWRLLALEPALDHRAYLRIHPANYSREGVTWSSSSVTAARELHNASLQCEAKQRRPPVATSATATAQAPSHDVHTTKLEIHVTYPPSFVISRWPGFGVSLRAGAAAALRCDVDANPPARAWWRRDDAPPDSSPPPPELGAERGSATLRWAALSAAQAGWYRCRATWLDSEYSSIGYYLNVLSPDDEPSSTSSGASDAEEEVEEPDHQKVDVPLGGNVQLHCPKGSVGCWWRRVLGNTTEATSAGGWAPAGSHHAHGVLGIKEALYQEGGEYRCVGARAPDLTRLRELKRVTLRVTGGATATAVSAAPAPGGWRLECGACGRSLTVLWLIRGRAIPASLAPDMAQHCWRAVLHVSEPDEVWCVVGGTGGGAVAVFPPRAPAPARHTVRALHGAASIIAPTWLLAAALLAFK